MKELHDNTEIDGFEPPRTPENAPPEEPEVEGVVSEDEEVTELSDEERSTFQSLVTIGQITRTIDVLGHPVILRTMSVADELMVGLESQKYRGSEAFARAYQSAVVAATVVTIDGKALYTPISAEESDSEVFTHRLKKVHALYPLVVSEIYRKYMEVESEFAKLAQKLGKLRG